MTINIYQQRSVPACISAAFAFARDNAGGLLRAIWPAALLFTLGLYGLMFFVCWLDVPLPSFATAGALLGSLLGAVALACGGQLWLNAKVLHMAGGVTEGRGVLRQLAVLAPVVTLFIVVTYLGLYALMPESSWKLDAFLVSLLVVVLLVSPPLQYALLGYTLRPDARFSGLPRLFGRGCRVWGRMFFALFLLGIIEYVVNIVCGLALIVLFSAAMDAAQSVEMGDAVGLPTLFPLWLALGCVVAGAVMSCWQVVRTAALACVYGGKECKE